MMEHPAARRWSVFMQTLCLASAGGGAYPHGGGRASVFASTLGRVRVPSYRLVEFDAQQRSTEEVFEAPNDRVAARRARDVAGKHQYELWRGIDLVASRRAPSATGGPRLVTLPMRTRFC